MLFKADMISRGIHTTGRHYAPHILSLVSRPSTAGREVGSIRTVAKTRSPSELIH